MEEIAGLAKVSVQTLYSHFGSKGGLVVALFDEEMGRAGLYVGFERVWSSPHGEGAFRAMLDATMKFWQRAWPLIAFALRVRRIDRELGARIDTFDQGRLDHLGVICRRLQEEGRLRSGLSPARAARLAFGLTTPYVYEALVVQNRLPASVARELAVEAVIGAVLKPGTRPVLSDKVDWARLGLRLPDDGARG
jgi:AcrR family transcriptional regulator